MNKQDLITAFEEAIPDMVKDAIWSSGPTNSLGFVKTKLSGTCELVVTLITDPDEWIREEPTNENTYDLTKEE